MKHQRLVAVALWLAGLAVCALLVARTHFVADMSAFLPKAPNARQQMLVEQLRDGIIARLIMVGIEADSPAERARLSEALAADLRKNPTFVGVQNGSAETLAHDQAYFFDNRYLLSPSINADRFSANGLHEAIQTSIDGLSGSAGMMLKHLLPRDPTGETLQLIEQFSGSEQPNSVEGVWASRDGKRALLLAQTSGAGSDIDAQAQAQAAIKKAFAEIPGRKADARLLLSGASVFSVSSRQTIESEVTRLATASTLLVICLLLAIYRSPTLLLLGLLPVFSGALAGIAAVGLGFGQIHGLTLGFGTTLIGEAVDYSIYLFIQRADTGDARGFWRTIRLGVLTSIAGFVALLFSGFPGLSQLGLYSISGLVAAALVTRFVLPQLIPAKAKLRDLSRFGLLLNGAIARLQSVRSGIVILLLAALGLLIWRGDAVWNRELGALSPVSAAEQKLDTELRGDMGAPEMRYMLVLTAPDVEHALQAAENLSTPLRELTQQGVIAGFTSPANVLPSHASQQQRRAALPEESALRTNLGQALQDMPIKAERLEGFVADIGKARTAPQLTRASLNGTSSALLVDSLVVQRARDVLVMLPLRAPANGEINAAKVDQALGEAGLPVTTFIDLKAESFGLYATYLHEAAVLAGLGCLAIVVLLLVFLRSLPRTLRICAPLACSVLCVTAGLVATGTSLTILHLVGLLLVVAVGSNYALFFDQSTLQEDEAARRQTIVSLCVANLTTVSSFGVLAASKVPVLSALGLTVGPGAFLALLFSAALAPKAIKSLQGNRA
ncbi:MMPL family transporter [Uliginosibacterium gangwonense]|uniref:MMPL family transporter n=1 Tax=Uliginosibacterium gangwonense TaxID=392736 RepID=UPI00037BFCA4|nr:MMPL family transporter [Uliginosibacterium gangwonense]